ncbi:MAG: hypothetical protein Q8O67_22690 [Deltaproteobacteria bacterium]|nr:hypothetical protein [Deltaproteobacteria bacterium]
MEPSEGDTEVLRQRNDTLAHELAASQARCLEAEEQRELAEKLVALAREFLMATRNNAEVLARTREASMGGAFRERAESQNALHELQRRALAGFDDERGVGRDYAHLEDVATFVEASVEARSAIRHSGVNGLAAIALLIRRREFRRGSS